MPIELIDFTIKTSNYEINLERCNFFWLGKYSMPMFWVKVNNEFQLKNLNLKNVPALLKKNKISLENHQTIKTGFAESFETKQNDNRIFTC